MKTYLKITTFLVLLIIIINSCSKKTEREGCTDPTALNYNTLAEVDDGSCEYIDSTITIWENGQVGYWGDALTGTFVVKSCFTSISTIFQNPDSTFTPADTIIDTLVTPPDTTITPADTVITGDTYLLINSDNSGNYELIIQLLNKRNAADFVNGYLIFNAKLHPQSTITDFAVFIQGNHSNSGGINCANFLQSDPINIFTSSLDTNSFNEIYIPLANFTNRYMQDVDLVFGIKGINATPNTPLIMINSIKWVSKLED